MTLKFKYIFSTFFTAFIFFFPDASYAQEENKIMQRIIVSKPDEAKEKSVNLNKLETKETAPLKLPAKQEVKAKIMETLGVKEEKVEKEIKSISKNKKDKKPYILPIDEMKRWKYIADLYNRKNADVRNAALKKIDEDISIVPPIFLYEASKILANKGEMEKASIYFHLAELRYSFDRQRFGYKKEKNIKGENPNKLMGFISSNTGRYIRPWLAKHPEIFINILDEVEEIDKNTPYHYHPNYSFYPKIEDKEEQEKILEKTRSDFFINYRTYAQALEQSVK